MRQIAVNLYNILPQSSQARGLRENIVVIMTQNMDQWNTVQTETNKDR